MQYCRNNDLINLRLTSKGVEREVFAGIYRHVDLQFDRNGLPPVDNHEVFQNNSLLERQQQFVRSLLSHPEYGRHVRILKGTLCVPTVGGFHELEERMISEEELWRAMQSLTHIQIVDLASQNTFTRLTAPKVHCPNHFISVRNIDQSGGLYALRTSEGDSWRNGSSNAQEPLPRYSPRPRDFSSRLPAWSWEGGWTTRSAQRNVRSVDNVDGPL